MSSLIPFVPDPNQRNVTNDSSASPGSPEHSGAQTWTPELAKLRDVDASGVTASLSKLLAARAQGDGRGSWEAAASEGWGLASLPRALAKKGDKLVLIGGAPDELGAGLFIKTVHGLQAGHQKEPDARLHSKLQRAVGLLAQAGVLHAGSSLVAGGLLVTAAELLVDGQLGTGIKLDLTAFGATRSDTLLFGENADRLMVAVAAERVGTVLSEAHTNGVPAAMIGELTDQPEFALFTRRLSAKWPVSALREARGVQP